MRTLGTLPFYFGEIDAFISKEDEELIRRITTAP